MGSSSSIYDIKLIISLDALWFFIIYQINVTDTVIILLQSWLNIKYGDLSRFY